MSTTTTTGLPAAPSRLDGGGPQGVAPPPAPPRRRRRGARTALAAAAVAVAGALAWAIFDGDGDGGAGAEVNDRVPTATAVAQRRDLVDTEDVEGTLGYAGETAVAASSAGTLTRIRPEGSSVRRGASLYSVDAQATAYVMYGTTPMYRTLRSGVSDGSDVRQLERNLVALGHDPYGAIAVDGEWDAATTAAVKRWEDARGVTEDGIVERGDVVFGDGPLRVGEHSVEVGEAVRAGSPVTNVTTGRRVIVARLAASRQSLVRRGQSVRVTLPDGGEVGGVVTRVGRVAKVGQDGAEATVELRVALLGGGGSSSDEGAGAGLDQAPVTVSIATQSARGVLAVPVTALIALGGGRYGVEVQGAGGVRRLADVQTGAFADGYVEVDGVAEGTRVVVPR